MDLLVIKYITAWKSVSDPTFSSAGGRFLPNSVKLKERTEVLPIIAKEKMFFVNRESAVLQLQRIHQSNFERAKTTDGLDFTVPICDNNFGLGKSAFARKYIDCGKESM